ncbi:hypothetical protein [Alcanivorax sp.]|jgi:hypothetical protein|uniref:hypothetical protein n=1 Tax=Alcanivorax sp. TaxID=1872427 RepID=UPI0039E60D0A
MALPPELVTSFIGGAVGASIGAVGFLYRSSLKSKKDYRKAIYALLGVYASLRAAKTLHPRNYLKSLAKAAHKLGHDDISDNEEFYKIMEPLVKPQIEALVSQIDSWNEAKLLNSIDMIASLNPILAHQLRANALLKVVVPQLRLYWVNLLNLHDEHGKDKTELEKSIPSHEGTIFEEFMVEVRGDILKLAWASSLLEYLKLKKLFREYEAAKPEDVLAPLLKKIESNFNEK